MFLKFKKVNKNEKVKIIEKMRADRAQRFRYLSLKKFERLIHFYQITENKITMETLKMNMSCNVLLHFRCGKDAHGLCASFGYWFIGHSFEF